MLILSLSLSVPIKYQLIKYSIKKNVNSSNVSPEPNIKKQTYSASKMTKKNWPSNQLEESYGNIKNGSIKARESGDGGISLNSSRC